MMVGSLGITLALSLCSIALAWPAFAVVFKELGSSGVADSKVMSSAIETIFLKMWIFALPITAGAGVFSFAGFWLLWRIIRRIDR